MYVRRNLRPSLILWFCWKEVLFFIALSSLVYWLYSCMHYRWVATPFLPVGTIGTAVAFYIGFKNNSSYERLWEGRKVWGSITNLSRNWGMLICALDFESVSNTESHDIKQRLIQRQINWCDLLRLQLRQTADYWNPQRFPSEVGLMNSYKLLGAPVSDLNNYLANAISAADKPLVEHKFNPAASLIKLQIADLVKFQSARLIPDSVAGQLLNITSECLKEQGSAERLKTFPFPRQYAYFSGVFVWIFLLLLPFSLIGELPKTGLTSDWLVVPFSTLISWIFLTMEQVGDTSEDPFANGVNDVPLSAICRNIEIELLEMLGNENLPPKILPVCDVLM